MAGIGLVVYTAICIAVVDLVVTIVLLEVQHHFLGLVRGRPLPGELYFRVLWLLRDSFYGSPTIRGDLAFCVTFTHIVHISLPI